MPRGNVVLWAAEDPLIQRRKTRTGFSSTRARVWQSERDFASLDGLRHYVHARPRV
jgi:hypothetical protein